MNLQELIDASSNVYIPTGIYETSGIFISSNKTITFADGVIIKASLDEDEYKLIKTRVAGINMMWYPALINIIDANNVIIKGHAIIDGQGEYWWNKYWGPDLKSGMRSIFDSHNARWACDYECMRPRNLLIQNSSNIIIEDIESYRSGFWNIHILYSHDIVIKNVKITTLPMESPSTDGIDIDSSYNVLIDSVEADCFDDSICIKSGRDMDGIRTNIPSHDIEIRNSIIKKGFGITIGSEVSGGIYNINIHDIKYINTDCGFRIKSARTRKGYIKNINSSNLDMTNVKYIFNMYLDWNPNYNKITKPDIKLKTDISSLYEEIPSDIKNTIIDGINIKNVKSTISKDYEGISRLFNIVGFDDSPMKNILIDSAKIKCFEYGIVKNADVIIINSDINAIGDENRANDEFDNR